MSEVMNVPEGWEVKSLDKFFKLKSGDTKPSDTANYGNNAVYGGNGITGYTNFINNDKETIIIGRVGEYCGSIYLVNKCWITDNALFIEKPISKFDMKYMFYKLSFLNLNQYKAETGQPLLNQTIIGNLQVNVPKEKTEQQKIAKILSTLDKTIEATQKLIEKEKNIKKGLMHDLLTNGIDSNNKIRTPQTHTYKQSELGLIPEEWELLSLKEITDKSDRYSFTGGPFGSDLKSSDYVTEGVRVIQLQNIGDGEFKNNDFIYTSEVKANELFGCQIFPGEILMSKMGDPVGRACLIPNIETKFVMCSDGIRVKVDQEKFDNEFILFSINDTYFRNSIERIALGSTRKRVGLIELKTLKLKIPTKQEQAQIAKILTTQDKKIQTEEINLAKLKELKKGLMNDLLSGEVRVKIQCLK